MYQEWARLIEKGEEPNPMSSRDGKLLKLICKSQHLSATEISSRLQSALLSHLEQEARGLLCSAWSLGRLRPQQKLQQVD